MRWSVGFNLPPLPSSQLPPVRQVTDLSFFAALARACLAQGVVPPLNASNEVSANNTANPYTALLKPTIPTPAQQTDATKGQATATPLPSIQPESQIEPAQAATKPLAPELATTETPPPSNPATTLRPVPPVTSPPTFAGLAQTTASLASNVVNAVTDVIPPFQLPTKLPPIPITPAAAPAPTPTPTPTPTTAPVVGPSPTATAASGAPWTLGDYPRPVGDTGRGFDWIPTLQSDPATVDQYVSDAKKMGASWVVFLNDNTQVGNNDYLVKQLVANHIEPVMRIYTSHGHPITGDLTNMVKHYVNLGVHYFVPYNEPNLPSENPNNQVSVSGYVDRWITAARAIVAGGGLPGLGGLAPGAPVDDVGFLRSAIGEIQARGATDLLNHGWIAMHNYTFNRPINYQADSNGFLKFRWYNQVVQSTLGRSLPIIGTEGGPRMGDNLDSSYPAVDQARRDQLVQASLAYLPNREPYFFANSIWVLANQAGGGHDPRWNADALFSPGGTPTPLAQQLLSQTEAT